MQLFGNRIWNDVVDNANKSYFVMQQDVFALVTSKLEEHGINYFAYEQKGICKMAVNQHDLRYFRDVIGDKLLEKMDRVEAVRSNAPKTIIGTVSYAEISQKRYLATDIDHALKIAERLESMGVPFSGRVYEDHATLTVAEQYEDTLRTLNNELLSERQQHRHAISQYMIVGNTSLNQLHNQMHFLSKMSPQEFLERNAELMKAGIPYSGCVKNGGVVLTVSKEDAERFQVLLNYAEAHRVGVKELEDAGFTGHQMALLSDAIDAFAKTDNWLSLQGLIDPRLSNEQLRYLAEKGIAYITQEEIDRFMDRNGLLSDMIQYRQEVVKRIEFNEAVKDSAFDEYQLEALFALHEQGITLDTLLSVIDETYTADEMEQFGECFKNCDLVGIQKIQDAHNGIPNPVIDMVDPIPDDAAITTTMHDAEEEMQRDVPAEAIHPLITDTAREDPQGDTFQILRLPYTDDTRNLRFEGYNYLISHGYDVIASNYDVVYTGQMDRQNSTLDGIYYTFNTNHPDDYAGYSLSVGDIIVLNKGGVTSAHMVESIGFLELPDFFIDRTVEREPQQADRQVDLFDLAYSDKNKGVIGNTPFRFISSKTYHKLDTEIAEAVANELNAQGIKFSGKINGEQTTLTISAVNEDQYQQISAPIIAEYRMHHEKIEEQQESDVQPANQEIPTTQDKQPKAISEETFAEQVDAVLNGTADPYSSLKVCDTPKILLDAGCEQLPMLYTQQHLRDALKPKNKKNAHFHGLDPETIKKIPEFLAEPAILFDSISPHGSGSNSIVAVLNATDNDNAPLVVSIVPNGSGIYQLEQVDANFITSIYGKDRGFEHYIQKATEAGNILFWDKKKSQELFMFQGLQLPEAFNNLDSDIIIHQSRNIVKSNSLNLEIITDRSESSHTEVVSDSVVLVPDTASATFTITDSELGFGGAKTKFQRNIEAIRVLKQLESEDRLPTHEEQIVLSQYVGWGGLPDAFDSTIDSWSKEYTALRELLTEDEYIAARASTENAHFTQPIIVEQMYRALEQFGFEGGRILEPAMGIGNFFGSMPSELRSRSELFDVELDSISGRIAQKLYPDADISVSGFEQTHFNNDAFDVVIGNVPFGDYRVLDHDYDALKFRIHDYFLAKSLDKLKPGGIMACITSSGTLDKKDETVRSYLAEKAELVGAIRLPGGTHGAFKANASTEVTADILFFRKREEPLSADAPQPEWVHRSVTPDGLQVNSYFVEHPEMVLGTLQASTNPFSSGVECIGDSNADLKTQLSQAIRQISTTIQAEPNQIPVKQELVMSDAPVRTYFIRDNDIYYRSSATKPAEMPPAANKGTKKKRIEGMIGIRDAVRDVIHAQLNGAADNEVQKLQATLQERYDAFYRAYGLIHSKSNAQAFREDDGYALICSLEKKFDLQKDQLLEKADIFTRRTIRPITEVEYVGTSQEALIVSLQQRGGIDFPWMEQLCGKSKAEMIAELDGEIYPVPDLKNPDHIPYQTADAYLSGNVRLKLRDAIEAAKHNPIFEKNVKALEAALPERLRSGDITVRLGATWIDPKYIRDFMYEVLDTPRYLRASDDPWRRSATKIDVQYVPEAGIWNITNHRLEPVDTISTT